MGSQKNPGYKGGWVAHLPRTPALSRAGAGAMFTELRFFSTAVWSPDPHGHAWQG
jgi:hypothetical protein